jgi:hypothetical protein
MTQQYTLNDTHNFSAVIPTASPLPLIDFDIDPGERWLALTWLLPISPPHQQISEVLIACSTDGSVLHVDADRNAVVVAPYKQNVNQIIVSTRNSAGHSLWIPVTFSPLKSPVAGMNMDDGGLFLFDDILYLPDELRKSVLRMESDADLLLALRHSPQVVQQQILFDLPDRKGLQEFGNTRKSTNLGLASAISNERNAEQLPVPHASGPSSRSKKRWWYAGAGITAIVLFAILMMIQNSVNSSYTTQSAPSGTVSLELTIQALVASELADEPSKGSEQTRGSSDTTTTSDKLSDAPLFPTSAMPLASLPAPTLTPTSTPPISLTVYAQSLVDVLNIRSGPGEQYDVIGTASSDQRFELAGQNSDGRWYRLLDEGWVAGWLVSLDGDVSRLVVLDAPPLPTPLPTPTP